jgi:small subunit ribosomal protein S20
VLKFQVLTNGARAFSGPARHLPASGRVGRTKRVATKKKVSSADKALRQSIKRRDHNRQLRSRLRTTLKSIREAVDTGDMASAKTALGAAASLVDKMANKGIIHRNAAGHYKSRLVKQVVRKGQAA